MARFTFVLVVFIWLAVACAFWDGWSLSYVRVTFRRWRRERRDKRHPRCGFCDRPLIRTDRCYWPCLCDASVADARRAVMRIIRARESDPSPTRRAS